MKWSYSTENSLGNLTFLWIIPEDPKTRSQSEDISILGELEVSQHSPPGRPVHPPYSSVFVTEFNPEYGTTDLFIWLRKRSSPKYIFYGNFLRQECGAICWKCACSSLLSSMPGHAQYTLGPVTCIDNVVDNARVGYHQMASYFLN